MLAHQRPILKDELQGGGHGGDRRLHWVAFGSFEIEHHVAHGAEAEVYCVRDSKHDRRLILRLDPNDDKLWDADPMLPPRNSSLEVRNAKGTWVAALNYRLRVSVDKKEFKFACASIYGVVDQRFLIPVTARFRVKNALSPHFGC